MRVGIDIGGTFTDFVFYDERSGTFASHKILSTPRDPADAVLVGLTDTSAEPEQLAAAHIIHGSTVATNAILERTGAATALITTAGFRDLLEIGRQNRPDIYDLFSRRPPALIPSDQRYEVDERVDHHGQPIRPLDPTTLDRIIVALRAANVASVAVSLLFSFLYPAHEGLIANRLRQAGFSVSLSSVVLPEFREYERTSTTVVNAYVSPIMARYLRRLEQESGVADFRVMQSNGGSIRASQARRGAVRCVLSGPAGGVVGARYVAEAAGYTDIITFDMGGTSTDVSLCAGDVQITTESEIGGMPIRIPVIDIHTVGSGGGSIAAVDAGGALRVGPQSAGADPGPICYGRGGQQPTVTDANLVLGRLAPDHFLGGQMALDYVGSEAALARLALTGGISTQPGLSPAQSAALGVVEIVNAHMERALRVISIQRGHDPRDFVLVSFGGAGALHAVELARTLNIPRVLVPPSAATLSAFGMLAADVIKDYVRTIMRPGETPYDELELLIKPLIEQGRADIVAEGVAAADVSLVQLLDVRYLGQSYELTIPLTPDFAGDFQTVHARTYGYSEPDVPLEIVNLRLRAVGHVTRPPLTHVRTGPKFTLEPFDHRPVVLTRDLATVPFYQGSQLQPGHVVNGPAVITQTDTTVFIDEGDVLTVDHLRNLIVDVE
jgi:N-methylhydantoinase A